MKLHEVEDAIAAHGVDIIETEYVADGIWGCYMKPMRLILVRHGLTHAARTATLLHELEHVKNGDEGHQSPRAEARINRRVARTLIAPDDWAAATRAHMQPTVEGLAVELDVPVWVVVAYVESLSLFM
ncbi:ImmA/IrrE family metallo-endopeptidase [Schaalia sp. lx-260]|uniref:ImmA/IrrE family metallo-endopeptidase n=1 Tax=Schaalia sp. lx-260 TaxID=2899082 RepID=UPI001E596C1B|nr:ImmA/IrrE family metallo-endopeptidase [Schaalia sp. lx-260]MCD4549709.1 ImmA/IrrE family metallo-endopeptidase [Schaalia sp. lx-260]